MISSLLHLVGLRPRVYYTLTNFRGGGKAPLAPPSIRQWIYMGHEIQRKKVKHYAALAFLQNLQHFYNLGSEFLQEVSDVKYLGIQIDNKPDWNKNILTVADRGQSKLAFLNKSLEGCPKKLRDTAYFSLIRPALEYSCSVWHPHKTSNKDKIEKFSAEQYDLFRTIFGVKQVSQKCYTIKVGNPLTVEGRINV